VKMEKFPDPTKPVYAPRDRRKEARYRTTMRNPTNPRAYLPPASKNGGGEQSNPAPRPGPRNDITSE